MTKSKTIIATLGIVAGLGAAALPLASYAATVSGNVDLNVEVLPAIAMSIQGNVDAEASTPGVDTYSVDATLPIDGHNSGTAYDSSDLQVSSSYVSLTPNHADTTTATSTIKVFTNDDGYTLSVLAAGANLEKDASNYIAPIATAGTAPTVSTNEGWGFKVTAATSGGQVGVVVTDEATTHADYSDWIAVPTTSKAIATASAKTASGDTFTVNYGVAIGEMETGVYDQTLTYTATTTN